MSPGTTTTFAERLVASGLLTPDEVAAACDAAGDGDALAAYLGRQGQLTPFQVKQLRAGASSFFVGKYVVVDCIGRGGNGIVFKARHKLMGKRFVALKTIDTRNLHHSAEATARFRREI